MKTTKKQFHEFIKHCERYRDAFGLLDWNIYYRREQLDDCYATINVDLCEKTATIKFSTDLDESDLYKGWIEKSAKHEMIHLLIGTLAELSASRFVTKDEIYCSVEGLVHSLEMLLK